MTYQKTIWVNGDVITAQKLNNIEEGIESVADSSGSDSSSGVFAGNIIIIGDSYTEGYTPNGSITSWATIVKNNSGCKNAIIKYQGGCGFGRENNGKTFYTLLQEAYAEIPEADRNTYTAVIIGGGYNDNGIDAATIRTGMHNCANFVKNNLPAARFIVAFLGWSREPDTLTVPSRRYTMARYSLALTGIKVQYIGDAYKALAFRESDRMSSDGRHPSQAGQDALAAHIIAVINGGNVEYNSEANQELGANINCYLTDEDFCVNVFGNKFLIPDTINQNAFNGSSINGVCNFNLPFTPPASSVPYNGCSIPGILNYKDASNNSIYRPCTITLRINAAGGFNVYVACINDAGTGWLSNANTLVSVFIPIGVYRWKIIDL